MSRVNFKMWLWVLVVLGLAAGPLAVEAQAVLTRDSVSRDGWPTFNYPTSQAHPAGISAVVWTGRAVSAGPLVRQWASAARATSQYGSDGWSAAQATGEPNVEECGDNTRAWASASSTGQDTLTLSYPLVVRPVEVNIHQTYTPGSITGVELVLADGSGTQPIPDSADPDTTCPHVFTLKVPEDMPAVNGVVIHLDQSIGGNWNEIDAVELVGQQGPGQMSSQKASTQELNQWASGAQASSQYGNDNWSASQATGAPNVKVCGDNPDAWASATSTGKDTLTLTYDTPVVPTGVSIMQTYTPGSITGVSLVLANGRGVKPIPNSADPDKTCPHYSQLQVPPGFPPVNGVIIHLDQSIGGNWNEIDAVQLSGRPVASTQVRQWASAAEATSQYGSSGWSATQATGAPNVNRCGDNKAAWASLKKTSEELLALYYDDPVTPTQVNIYQTYNPGAITGVDLLLADGSGTKPIPNSADPDKTCPHVFKLQVPPGFPPVSGVAIHLDQSKTGNWSEIDAVELVGQ